MSIGLAVICIVGFPYIMVGKYPNIFSVAARHGMIAGSGFGLFIIGLIHLRFKNKKSLLAKIEKFIFFQLILYFIVLDISYYAMWQARWAKDLAISEDLSRQTPLNNTSIYFFRGYIPSGADNRYKYNYEYYYEYNDVTLILNRAWGGEKNIGISPMYKTGRPDLEVAREVIENWHTGKWIGKNAASRFNPEGCMGEIIVNLKTDYQGISIGFLYLYYKIFRDSKQMKAFLGDLVSVEMRSLNLKIDGNACS